MEVDESGDLIVSVGVRGVLRCGECGHKCPLYDQGDGRSRRWRHLDFGSHRCFLEAKLRRTECAECGVRTEAASWADHKARHTRQFDELAVWLAQRMDRTSISSLLGIAWRTVGSMIKRVVARQQEPVDFTKLRAIDMSAAYRKAVEEKLVNAQIVYDRFHVQALASDAVDATRREEWHDSKGTPKGVVSHALWHSHPSANGTVVDSRGRLWN